MEPAVDGWFNLATGEALAEYNPSPAMRELVAGVESQREKRADPHLSASTGGIAHITVETRAPTYQSTRVNAFRHETKYSHHANLARQHIKARTSTPMKSARKK